MKYFLTILLMLISLEIKLFAAELQFFHYVPQINVFRTEYLIATSVPKNQEIANICADGSKSTTIKFQHTGQISTLFRFKIKEDMQSYADQYGDFSNYLIKGNLLQARYIHPKFVGSGKNVDRFTLQVLKLNAKGAVDSIIYETPIDIYNAPLLTLDGLFGKGDYLNNMTSGLGKTLYPARPVSGKYPQASVYGLSFTGNYSEAMANSFTQNELIAMREIDRVLMICRINNFSAGKVDLIGINYGGILARLWLQNSQYQDNIKRLILIHTPNSGTPLANLLLSSNFIDAIKVPTRFLLKGNIEDGALNDLKVDGPGLQKLLNNKSNLNRKIVPTHNVIGRNDSAHLEGFYGLSLITIAGILQGKYIYLFDRLISKDKVWVDWRRQNQAKVKLLTPLYEHILTYVESTRAYGNIVTPRKIISNIFGQEGGDSFSPMSSQMGGIPQTSTSQYDNMTINELVNDAGFIKNLGANLMQDPGNQVFTMRGINPVTLNADEVTKLNATLAEIYRVEKSMTNKNDDQIQSTEALENESVTITSPKNGTNVKSGQKLDIVVAGTDSVTVMCLSAAAVQSNNESTFSTYTPLDTAKFEYNIPNDVVGELKIYLRGYLAVADSTGSQWTKPDTITVNVVTDAKLDSIGFGTDNIFLTTKDKIKISVKGWYSDKVIRDITGLLKTSDYIIADKTIFNITGGNITPLKQGTAELRATYGGKNTKVNVIILPDDAFSTKDTITSVDDGIYFESGRVISSLSNYPNPFSDYTEIRFSLLEPASCRITVTDILGNVVYESGNLNIEPGDYTERIDAGNFVNGIYFYTLTAGKEKLTKSFNILK